MYKLAFTLCLLAPSITASLCAQTRPASDDSLSHLSFPKEEVVGSRSIGDTGSTGNKRTLKAIAEAAAATQRNMLGKEVSPLYKRAQEGYKKRAAYLQDLAAGRVRSFPSIVKNWAVYKEQRETAVTQYANYSAATVAQLKAKYQQDVLRTLQDIGHVLESADHQGAMPNVLTPEQVLEQKSLEKEFKEVSLGRQDSQLKLLTPDFIYTLKFLPTPIHFSAPAGTEIILSSPLGGVFSNRLSKIKLTTNAQGQASAVWFSNANAVGNCLILFRSDKYAGEGVITPVVKSLNLIPLDSISKMTPK